MAIKCPKCGAEYDVTLFPFGRTIRCDCGASVDLADGHQQTSQDGKQATNMSSNHNLDPKWLRWSRQLMAIAQNGLTFVNNPFDKERYEAIRAIAAEILSDHTGTDWSQITDLFSREVGYATPKVDVRGVVIRDNTILLVKERADGLWTLPGGWADVNESPSEAVVREVYEESGYRTRAARLLAVLDRSKHCNIPPLPFHIYKIFILCELLGGDPATSHEIDDVAFFAENELPELSLSRTTPAQIVRMFEHFRCPDLPPDFD